MSLQLAQSPFLGFNLIRLWALPATRVSSQPALLLVMLEAALLHSWYWSLHSAAAAN